MAHSPETYDRTVQSNNGDWVETSIPPAIAEYLGVKPGTKIRFQKEEGEHGKYASFWKVEEETPEESSSEDGTQV